MKFLGLKHMLQINLQYKIYNKGNWKCIREFFEVVFYRPVWSQAVPGLWKSGPERYGYNSTDVIYKIFCPFATDKTVAVEKTLQIY